MFSQELSLLKNRFETENKKIIEDIPWQKETKFLKKQLEYVLLNNGKKIRAILNYATSIALDSKLLHFTASSIEILHTYSLIHDDLPSMDNDDFRRGKPSAHKQFGEANAILLGDGLQSLAFEVLAQENVEEMQKSKMILELAKASGFNGMVAGQSLDVNQKYNNLEQLIILHKLKTGKLIETSIKLAILGANLDIKNQKAQNLIKFSSNIGLCFQIQDDILDYTSTKNKLGKTPGKDLLQNKKTFVSFLGIEKAKGIMEEKYQESIKLLKNFKNSKYLKEIAQIIIQRDS